MGDRGRGQRREADDEAAAGPVRRWRGESAFAEPLDVVAPRRVRPTGPPPRGTTAGRQSELRRHGPRRRQHRARPQRAAPARISSRSRAASRTPGPPGPAPRITPGQWLCVLVLAGFGMAGFSVAATAAGHHTDPAFVVVGTAPLVVGVLTPLFARARPSGRVVAAGVLVAAPLVAPLGALRVSASASASAVPICLAGVVATGAYVLPTPGQLAAVATAVAYVLWFTALDVIGAERAVLVSGSVPLSAVATTAVMGAGAPGAGHVVGAVAVVAGRGTRTVERRPARLRGRAAPDGEGGVAWVSDSVPPSSTAPISTP
ncbi:EamA/RhaT family transporter [Streptomyces albidoflavus]|uniref:EamA/RhaT family transporter n=1 Tax=Streptomyces albidoflavus TaxID=1886 RepID=UPI0038B2C0E7|nr:EamA/RhaT family transporter [Streptomyces albidoflavus]